MNCIDPDQYYKILGVNQDASLDQIKRAYRRKARLYHPDLNKREEAADIFIVVNEAYEYLTEKFKIRNNRSKEHDELVNAWQKYRREEARRRAYISARERYKEFTKSQVYRTSMVLNRVQLYINLSVSVFIITMTIIGYIIKLGMVNDGFEPPSLAGFIFLLTLGSIYFLVSLAHILSFIQNRRKTESYEKSN